MNAKITLQARELELKFDQFAVSSLWPPDLSSLTPNDQAKLRILAMADKNQLRSLLIEADHLFFQSTQTQEKVFAIQWAVSATEVLYDMKARSSWLMRWNLCDSWAQDPWNCYIHRDQQALTYYYENSFRDALRLFEFNRNEAQTLDYPRGEYRSLFHIGLIYKIWGQLDKATTYFELALKVAQIHNAKRFILRINEQLELTSHQTLSHDAHLAEIEQLLRTRNYRAARKLALFCCRIRRQEGRSYQAKSENAYLAVVCYSLGQQRRFETVLRTITDHAVREFVLRLCNDIFPLPLNKFHELEFLRSHLGYPSLQIHLGKKSLQIYGIEVAERDTEVMTLILSLAEAEHGLDKEEICRKVWRISYDPFYHDGKIYRLIHKARQLIPMPNLIINDYGSYRLNPEAWGGDSHPYASSKLFR